MNNKTKSAWEVLMDNIYMEIDEVGMTAMGWFWECYDRYDGNKWKALSDVRSKVARQFGKNTVEGAERAYEVCESLKTEIADRCGDDFWDFDE